MEYGIANQFHNWYRYKALSHLCKEICQPILRLLDWRYFFLSDPGLSTGPIYGSSLCEWMSTTPSVNLTDVTLTDIETNLILTDKVNRVIQGNVALQVTQPGSQVRNWSK